MAGPYHHQRNGVIDSFSFCSKQKDFFSPEESSSKILSCPCPLSIQWSFISLSFNSRYLQVFCQYLILCYFLLVATQTLVKGTLGSGINKWHVDKATVVSKEKQISYSHASNTPVALLNVTVSLKLCGKIMPKGTGNLQHLRELLFQVDFSFLTELH